MDITSLIGPAIGLGMVILGLSIEGGDFGSMMHFAAALIVFGGAFGALLVAYPLRDVLYSIMHLSTWLRGNTADHNQIRLDILDLAQIARRESVLSLEKVVDNLSFSSLEGAVRLAIDGTDPELIKDTLQVAMDVTRDEQQVAANFWEDYGGLTPTFGVLGAVLGLIHVMENLDRADLIGPGIAVAFVATLYGVGGANLFFLPIAKKLKRRFSEENNAREMVIIGIDGILTGVSPKLINEKLMPYCRKRKDASLDESADAEKKAA